MNRRFLFVQLPFFASERHSKTKMQENKHPKPWWDAETQAEKPNDHVPKGPLVLVTHGTKGTRISALGPDGAREGLWCDMKLNDARAMLPHIQVETHDVIADRMLHNRLAHWMLRYSPRVALHGKDSFVLDIAGCTHLFGGEEAMGGDIAARFKHIGFSCRLAFADTVGAAMALVQYGKSDLNAIPQGAEITLLDNLPVEALRLNDETLTLLKRLGLKRIGDVRPLPRASLERRFHESKKGKAKSKASGQAQSVQWRLDQLSGVIAEPLTYISETKTFRATKQCPAMALEMGAVEIALQELLPNLCIDLQKAGQGAREFRLTGYKADGGISSVNAALSQPTHDGPTIIRLFKDRLDQIDCGFGIDLFVLEAMQTSEMKHAQHDGFDEDKSAFSSTSIASFADVLANRKQGASVMKLAPRTSHVPERAQMFVHTGASIDWEGWYGVQPTWAPRPMRIFARPEAARVTAELPDSPPVQFIWRKRLHKIRRSRGPERILPEWWHDNLKSKRSPTFRDYYDVEDEEGLRYWIFRAIKDEPVEGSDDTHRRIDWYVHGLF